MSVIAAAVKHMLAAGMPQEAIVAAIEEMEAVAAPVRSKAAERQARYRERNKASQTVTSDACDAKSAPLDPPPNVPEPLNTPPYNPPQKQKTGEARGSFIPDGWQPSDAGFDHAIAELGSEEVARRELERFRDFWAGKSGADGRKRNWEATWRNWVRKAADDQKRNHRNGSGRAPGHHHGGARGFDAVPAALAAVARQRGLTDPGRGEDLDTSTRTAEPIDADWWPAGRH